MGGHERTLLKLRESGLNPPLDLLSLFPLFFHTPVTRKCHGADVGGSDSGWR